MPLGDWGGPAVRSPRGTHKDVEWLTNYSTDGPQDAVLRETGWTQEAKLHLGEAPGISTFTEAKQKGG